MKETFINKWRSYLISCSKISSTWSYWQCFNLSGGSPPPIVPLPHYCAVPVEHRSSLYLGTAKEPICPSVCLQIRTRCSLLLLTQCILYRPTRFELIFRVCGLQYPAFNFGRICNFICLPRGKVQWWSP